MKKLIVIFIISFIAAYASAQTPLPPYVRSGSLVQPQDYRLQTILSFKMPVAQDTTLNGSADSLGMQILRLIDTSVYVRVPSTPGINKWIKLLKLGEGIAGSYVTSFNSRTGSVTLTSLDVTTALGYTPVTNARTITINGTAQDLSDNRSWVVGDVFQSGSYANPAWITSLAWSKITGAPTIGSGTVTNFSAGDLSPLFTTTETNPTTTPALTFGLSNAAANSWFGNAGAALGAPSYNIAGAITRTNDTNVTLTLGGTPLSAALKAVSLTLGWSGTLSVSRGGLGMGSTPGNHKFLMGNGTGYEFVDFVAGTNMTIDYATGAITFNASGGGPSSGGGGVFTTHFDSGSPALDSSLNVLPADRKEPWYKISGVASSLIDGIRYKIVSGDTLMRGSGSSFRAEELGIYANGSNMSSLVQAAFNYDFVNLIKIDPDSGRVYTLNGTINAHGGSMSFDNDGRLTGAAIIDSLIFTAGDYSYIFDTTLTFTNLSSSTGYITPNQLGAKMDGVSNDIRYFVLGHKISAENGLEFRVPAGTFYISGTFPLLSNGSLIGAEGSKINANPGTAFTFNGQMIHDLKIINNDFELIGSGTTNTSFFNLGTTGDSSYNIIFKENKIQAHRWGNYTVYVTGLRDSRFEGNEIDSSYNGSMYFEECWDTWIGGNRVTNAGRSGISGYRHNKRLNIYKNFVTGFSQNIDLTDGGIDLYGPDNEDITVEGNIVNTGDSSLDGNFNHIPFRFQGFRRLKVINNTAICKSQYLLYAYRFSNRDDYESQDVEAYGNSAYITGYYSRVVSFQGTRNITFRNYHLKVATTATPSSDPYMFYVADIPLVDTVRTLDLGGGDINMNGKAGTLLAWDTPVKDIIMSGTKVDSLNGNTYLYSTAFAAQSFTWLGGSINSTFSSSLFRIYNVVRAFNIQNLTITKSNSILWNVEAGYNGVVIPAYNIINGRIASVIGGSTNKLGIYYDGDANYTVNDTTAMVVGNRTGSNMTVTLPPSSIWPGRLITIKNVSPTRGIKVNVVAGGDKDSIIYKQSVTYVADTSGWRAIGFYAENTSADSSVFVTKTRLQEVADSIIIVVSGNDTLYGSYARDGDSIRLILGDQEWAVYSPLATGADFTPSLTNVANVSSSTVGDFRYNANDSVVHCSGKFLVTPTAGTTLTTIRVSLPLGTTLPSGAGCWGTGGISESGNFGAVQVSGDDVTDTAVVSFKSLSTSSHVVTIEFTYTRY